MGVLRPLGMREGRPSLLCASTQHVSVDMLRRLRTREGHPSLLLGKMEVKYLLIQSGEYL